MSYNLSAKDARVIKTRLDVGETNATKLVQEPFERALKLYVGDHYTATKSRRARVSVNYTMHVIETRVHGATFRYPRFDVTPETQIGEQTEPIVQANLKYYWRIGDIQAELKRVAKDREMYGVGIVLTGWKFETEEMLLEDGREEAPEAKVREDRFLAKRIHPRRFLVPPETGQVLAEAQWCGYWELRPLDEVKGNTHFTNVRQLKGTAANMQDLLVGTSPEDAPSDLKRVKLYHYFERQRQIHVIMCDEHDKPLYAEKWGAPTGRYPFRTMHGPGDTDCFWALPMPILIEHQQRELNEARSQLSAHRKGAVPKYQCGPGTMTTKARLALESDEPFAVAEHNSETPGAIAIIQPHTIQPEVYQTEERMLADIQAVAAVSQYQLGNAPTKRTPTAEVNQIASLGGARAQADLQSFETLCAEVATDCIAWLKVNAVKTRELPIYEPGTDTRTWINFTREQIKGDYDISVAAGSTAAPNDADRLQSIAFFIQSLVPILQMLPAAGQNGLNLKPLLKQLLKSLPEIEDVNEILEGLQTQQPGIPPEVVQMIAAAIQQAQQAQAVQSQFGPQVQGPGPASGGIPPELLAALQAAQGGA